MNRSFSFNRLFGLVISLCCLAAACGTGNEISLVEPTVDRVPVDVSAPVDDWVAGVNAAGWDFHRSLSGNAVSSPLSIGTAFSLSRAGASANSETALDEIFGFPEDGIHSAANTVSQKLDEASANSTVLEVANRLFADIDFSPLADFVEVAGGHYGAVVQTIDTSDGAAGSEVINHWVSAKTRGLIPMIVNEGIVKDQELILVNTVYMKADWAVQFLPGLTHEDQFNTGTGESVTVQFMRDSGPEHRRFARLEDADAVELAYRDGGLAMWLVVPHDIDGLEAIEESLNIEGITSFGAEAETGYVHLTMPKWEQTLPPTDLFEWLCPLGFCAGASFDGIAPGIFITSALHGAKVIVDEKGTEAAAATSGSSTDSEPPPVDLTIVADRPFLWAIIHQNTGTVLFIGRLVNPVI